MRSQEKWIYRTEEVLQLNRRLVDQVVQERLKKRARENWQRCVETWDQGSCNGVDLGGEMRLQDRSERFENCEAERIFRRRKDLGKKFTAVDANRAKLAENEIR